MFNTRRVAHESWYTDSTYNADGGYENSPFATDPATFPGRASSVTSTSLSQPYAMIPLPNQYSLYTIQEMGHQEDVEPPPTVTKRMAESLAVSNENLIEKSLRNISLIRSRLLQQQEFNRKKNSEFQQIRSSLEAVRSLVHLIHDEKANRTFVEFSTIDANPSLSIKNLKLSKTPTPNTSGNSLLIDDVEPKTPTKVSALGSSYGSSGGSSAPVRSFKAMSITTQVPTTPTKAAATPTTEILNFYRYRSAEDLRSSEDMVTKEELNSVLCPPSPSPISHKDYRNLLNLMSWD